ncbi:hypothetical protein Hanom_Chr01g00066881 [Helianthus anomalus]
MELTGWLKMARFQTFWIQIRKNKPLDESDQTTMTEMTFYSFLNISIQRGRSIRYQFNLYYKCLCSFLHEITSINYINNIKKPSAGGLCDAVLLARLRHEQWSSVPFNRRKKEIYVLTRNLRSTAYRLALATIVLEHQQEDFDYV